MSEMSNCEDALLISDDYSRLPLTPLRNVPDEALWVLTPVNINVHGGHFIFDFETMFSILLGHQLC